MSSSANMSIEEKRKSRRFQVKVVGGTVIVGSANGHKETRSVVVKDISPDGAYLVADAAPKPGCSVQVSLDWPVDGGWSTAVLQGHGTVVRIDKLSEAQYGIGLYFQQFDWKPRPIQEQAFEYHAGLQRVRSSVEKDCSQRMSLKDASHIAAMEATYFSSLFHARVGVCFRDWLSQTRVARAMDLLGSRDYSVSEVAWMVGYADLRPFERAFRRVVKLSPRDFRKLVRPA